MQASDGSRAGVRARLVQESLVPSAGRSIVGKGDGLPLSFRYVNTEVEMINDPPTSVLPLNPPNLHSLVDLEQ